MADRELIALSGAAILNGTGSPVQSGRAIEARQRQSVLGIETYMDNSRRIRAAVEDCLRRGGIAVRPRG